MKRILLVTVLCVLILQAGAFAQVEGINIFGYYQGQFEQSIVSGKGLNRAWNTLNLQQMNIMLSKDLSPAFSSFISLQLSTNFNSAKGWGSLNVEEAWVKYRGSDYFNIKAGLLVPTFNNFNEIKTKTPLLPYIMRPLVYESPMADLVSATNFIPENAFFQIYGVLPAGPVKIDYAVYAGNNQPDFISTVTKSASLSGQDTSKFKLFGGRIGVRSGSLKIGVSGTYDRTNPGSPYALPAYFRGTPLFTVAGMIGPVVRNRIGVDASYQVAGFTVEGEYIGVFHTLKESQKSFLKMVPLLTAGNLYDDLDKATYYVTLVYDFNEEWYSYASYAKLQDNFNVVFHSGMNNYSVGGGYRPTGSVVVKAQYAKYEMIDRVVADFAMDRYSLAVSVYF
jgi:hypothetical protein